MFFIFNTCICFCQLFTNIKCYGIKYSDLFKSNSDIIDNGGRQLHLEYDGDSEHDNSYTKPNNNLYSNGD